MKDGPGKQRIAPVVVPGWVLCLLMAACVWRLWLMPLPSSFWVDEMATAFVVEHGANHPSLAVAPQVPQSIYYWLPRVSDRVFGLSEISYRMPSVLVMGIALVIIAKLAARLIHPDAGWFAAFACLALKGLNYFAIDARPYGLGICVAAATIWFLVRWLDSVRWLDAAAFIACAALLWRVHLIYWPFYFILPGYAAARVMERSTAVGWLRASAVFAIGGLTLVPVAMRALALLREAPAHVIVPVPPASVLAHYLKWNLVFFCAVGPWLARRIFHWQGRTTVSGLSTALILGWALCQPVFLFAFSWVTGDSVFIPRYLSLSLPGIALAATAAAAWFLPPERWRFATACLSVGALVLVGSSRELWPPHDNADWRSAARAVNRIESRTPTPVICTSPFIEARPPEWKPDYKLPGFLYSQLAVYPIDGMKYLFPFEDSPEAERYASELLEATLDPAGRFILYGGAGGIRFWRKWFAARLPGWSNDQMGSFGDVWVIRFRAATVRER